MDLLFKEITTFVGKIIAISPYFDTVEGDRILFSTPHGSVIELPLNQVEEPDINDIELLLNLEEEAIKSDKLLYGGEAAVGETLRFLTIKKGATN